MTSVVLSWVLALLMACILGLTQYKYALSGYPRSVRWRVVLVLAGFLTGVSAGWVAVSDFEGISFLAVMLVLGMFLGYASLKWLPQRSRTFMSPPRDND